MVRLPTQTHAHNYKNLKGSIIHSVSLTYSTGNDCNGLAFLKCEYIYLEGDIFIDLPGVEESG